MGLISHGIAVGIGYYIAQPGGQRQLNQLRQRAVGWCTARRSPSCRNAGEVSSTTVPSPPGRQSGTGGPRTIPPRSIRSIRS